MKFLVDLCRDLARDLEVVALALAVTFAAAWVVLRTLNPESDN